MEGRGGREGRRDYREDVEDQGMSVLGREKKKTLARNPAGADIQGGDLTGEHCVRTRRYNHRFAS